MLMAPIGGRSRAGAIFINV